MKTSRVSINTIPTHLENISTGMEICEKAKEQFVCSNDIMPKADRPFIYPDEFPQVAEQFGERRLKLFLKHLDVTNTIRSLVTSMGTKHKIGKVPIDIAITHFGVGECQESASFVMLELLKKGRTDFASIVLYRRSRLASDPDRVYLHNLILLGSQFPEKGSMDLLNTLPDDVVVIDPYLNHVGSANTYIRDQLPYLSAFQYNEICAVAKNTHPVNVIDQVQSQIDFLVNELKDSLICFDRRELLLSSSDELCRDERIDNLNQYAVRLHPDLPLNFCGVRDKNNRKIDAFVQIKSLENAAACIALKDKLKAGFFSRGGKHAIFTLPDVNNLVYEAVKPSLKG